MIERELHLTLKRKWFEMIVSGEKKEEYRVIKPYWESRLNKSYSHVVFRNGYNKSAPKAKFKLLSIIKGKGLPEWGAPVDDVFIIFLGDKV